MQERIELIKELYEEEGLTQREIAVRLGLSLGSINRYLQMARDEDNDLDNYRELNDDLFPDEDEDENSVSSPTVKEGADLDLLNSVSTAQNAINAERDERTSSPTVKEGAKAPLLGRRRGGSRFG